MYSGRALAKLKIIGARNIILALLARRSGGINKADIARYVSKYLLKNLWKFRQALIASIMRLSGLVTPPPLKISWDPGHRNASTGPGFPAMTSSSDLPHLVLTTACLPEIGDGRKFCHNGPSCKPTVVQLPDRLFRVVLTTELENIIQTYVVIKCINHPSYWSMSDPEWHNDRMRWWDNTENDHS